MERFYSLRLLNFTHRRPGYLRIAKHFLCPGWDTVNMDSIKKHSIENEFFVESVNNSSHFYTVNSEIGTCTCRIGITGAPCNHQGAVSVKFHISMFNFIPSLTSNNCIIYAYIAIGKKIIKKNQGRYSNRCAQLHTALNKFAERYKAGKLKSIPRLVSFLYDINRELDPAVNIRSGFMIRVQVESVKRRKTKGSKRKRKPFSITNNKENLENSDPQIIPGQKTKKIGKK
ncbi:hypothetical protein RhiirA5_435193 [Rhizophagus irregularis]|uniref:SWIM-type domain-containing protein n=1 Tax=Rhizophagus irregularis TaxID=588596 RepID=A0A2N0NNT3_9GLOM|nr:hypothetical protein RhiirA5_435193 [Rhizophagus irregularis]